MRRIYWPRLRDDLRFRAWLLRRRLGRLRRVWCYGVGRLTTEDAQDILVECRHTAGWYSLSSLCVEDALESALDQYQDHPELRCYIAIACARVANKWEANGDERYAAQAWALRLAVEFAADDGIAFTPVEPANPESAPSSQALA